MSKQKAKFKKFGPPPTLLSVGPKGQIEALPWCKNNNSPVEMRGSKMVLAGWMRDSGWISLSSAFADDSREPVKQGGMRAYKDWLKARRASRAAKVKGATRVNGEAREKFKPYPEHLLPDEVIARREGRGTTAVEEFVPGIPGLDPDSGSEPDTVSEVSVSIDASSEDHPHAKKQGRRRRAPAADKAAGPASDAPKSKDK